MSRSPTPQAGAEHRRRVNRHRIHAMLLLAIGCLLPLVPHATSAADDPPGSGRTVEQRLDERQQVAGHLEVAARSAS